MQHRLMALAQAATTFKSKPIMIYNMNKLVFTFSLIVAACSAGAQNPYKFTATTATYQELTGAKRISFAQMDSLSGLYPFTELNGEIFRWYKLDYKMDSVKVMYLQPYANVRMDNDSSIVIVDGAFTYLDSIDASSSISYKIEGTPGDYIIKSQWKNLSMRAGKPSNYMNVQIWVYQKSGIFEVRYGPSSAGNQSGFDIGSGPNVGIFYSPLSFTKCYSKLWITGYPGNPQQDSFANYNFKAMFGVSVDGTVFRFTPRFKTLEIDDQHAPEPLRIFPNPANNVLYISRPGSYHIVDMLGATVIKSTGAAGIDISVLPNGVYTLVDEWMRPARFVIDR